MKLANDKVHGPRRKMKVGPYKFTYHGLCEGDPDNPRFVYHVGHYTDCPDFSDAWTAYYRESVGGFDLVAFGNRIPVPFIPMGQIGRDSIALYCVP